MTSISEVSAFLRYERRVGVFLFLLALLLKLPFLLSLNERISPSLEVTHSATICCVFLGARIIALGFCSRWSHRSLSGALEGLRFELMLLMQFLAQFFALLQMLLLSPLKILLLCHGSQVAGRGGDERPSIRHRCMIGGNIWRR